MTLEFEQAVKALGERIDILKQELFFAMAMAARGKKPQSGMQEIITIKKELDKAVEERMKLVQIYSNPPMLVSS